MKTTNFEISKKLAEIGFETGTKFCWEVDYINANKSLGCWFRIPENLMPDYEYVLAYDLETILEVLPNRLPNKDYYLTMTKYAMWYCDINDSDIRNREELYLVSVHNEGHSLADIAALLLITLHEKGLIEFDK